MKKFITNNFLDLKMIDLRIVMSQVQEFQLNLHDIYAESLFLSESFHVTAIIENYHLEKTLRIILIISVMR
jgi:hypothetical protein